MAEKNFCIAANGLDEALFGNPLSQCATFLNEKTPSGVHFVVVGGADPRPYLNQIIHNCLAAANAGYRLILIGHSLGAMLMFYIADALKARGVTITLLVPIDATDWGSNIDCQPYQLNPPKPGQYLCPDNVDRCIYYRQPGYPGGGFAQRAAGNEHTAFESYERVEAHVVLPILPDIQQHILQAVLAATQD
jgi:hypothetical protein